MNLLEYPSELEGVAIRAAKIYGQEWETIPTHSRARWEGAVRDAVADVGRGGSGSGALENAACQAVKEWIIEKHKPAAVVAPKVAAKVAKPEVVEAKAPAKIETKKK